MPSQHDLVRSRHAELFETLMQFLPGFHVVLSNFHAVPLGVHAAPSDFPWNSARLSSVLFHAVPRDFHEMLSRFHASPAGLSRSTIKLSCSTARLSCSTVNFHAIPPVFHEVRFYAIPQGFHTVLFHMYSTNKISYSTVGHSCRTAKLGCLNCRLYIIQYGQSSQRYCPEANCHRYSKAATITSKLSCSTPKIYCKYQAVKQEQCLCMDSTGVHERDYVLRSTKKLTK
jgi:hypothetical protein